MNRFLLTLGVLVLASVACNDSKPRHLDLYPTATVIPTQTPYFIIHTATPNATYTAVVVVATSTPNAALCVNASEAVYLRPSPNADNYPILAVPNGSRVMDLGGRSGSWLFVALGETQGWINQKYLEVCK